ncbi:uncharacterized protein LOC111260714 [Varroa jacobsoni]|uniref:uncharacterized protein LOC111260714 n=1 Tax=Varroa jacobsoni TaxID=62625 RepID=UPI000BF5BF36|nr:uncharacterized protein LOC111260714 [Varroa jacobsoni]XP_022689413.1 uncharacterized protein LOC111260714 [Varroa jacobsoni]XP_022689414.1 uncharacterized protein LOC111260714 [Varroa jacobsoni]
MKMLRIIIPALFYTASNIQSSSAQATLNEGAVQLQLRANPTSLPCGLPIICRRQQQLRQPQHPVGHPSYIPIATTTNFGIYSPETLCAQGPDLMQGYPVYPQQKSLFGVGSSATDSDPCSVTCENQKETWMVAKPSGTPCRHPNDPTGERYCVHQVCVIYNASLNKYCREALNLNSNSPNYMALMPYGCTISCLDKSIPFVVQVQLNNGMACQVHVPGGRRANGYCVNGACSTLTHRVGDPLNPRPGAFPEGRQTQAGPTGVGYPTPIVQGYPYTGGSEYPGYEIGDPLGHISLPGRR